jgi:WD40 repeat protein
VSAFFPSFLLDISYRFPYCFTMFSRKASLSLCVPLILFFATRAHAAIVVDPSPPSGLPDVGASAPLVSVAYSPDGNLLYTLGTTGELIGRGVRNQQTVIRGNVGAGATKIRALPDGSLLIGYATGGVIWYEKPVAGKPLARQGEFPSPQVKPQVNDPISKDTLSYELELEDYVPSPDSALLAVAITETTWKTHFERRSLDARNALLQVWDMRSKTIVHSWEPIPLAKLPRRRGAWDSLHLAWGNNGRTLDVAMPNVNVQQFDPHTGALLSEWKPSAEDALQANPAAKDAEMKRRFSQLPPGVREKALQAYERRKAAGKEDSSAPDFGQTQAISPDGKLLLAATPNGWQLWDIKSNSNVILEKARQLAPGDSVQFSADNTMLAIHSEGWFWAWRSDGTQIGFAHVPFVNFGGSAFSPHGKYLALGDDTGTADQWELETPLTQTANTLFPGFFAPWRHLSIAPNLMIAATDRFAAKLDAKGHPHWFNNEPIKAPTPLSDNEKRSVRAGIDHLAAAPDGKSWAEYVSFQTYFSTMEMEGFPRGELRGRDAKTGQILWRQADEGASPTLNVLKFLADGTLLTGGRGGGVSVRPLPNSFGGLQARDGRNGEPTQLGIAWDNKRGFEKPFRVEVMQVSRDGKRLVVFAYVSDSGIQVVDIPSKQVIQYFGNNISIERGEWALSPDGQWLARAAKTRIDLWNLNQPRNNHNVNQPRNNHSIEATVSLTVTSPAQALCFGNDNSLAVGLQDGRILLWAPNPTPDAAPLWETKPGRAINVLQFSLDGKTLWSGDERGDLKTRNAQNGQLQSTLRLLPPVNESAAPAWVRWTRNGEIENSRG